MIVPSSNASSKDPQPLCHGDANFDSRIDLADFGAFQECYAGAGTCAADDCEVFDWDSECDVDLTDYEQYHQATTGPDVPIEQCD